MANLFVRTYTFVDGTTAFGSQVEAEVGNIVNVLNNLNTAITTWGQVSSLHATNVPLIADCAAGSQHIADFKNNSVIKASVLSTGQINALNGIAMNSTKITGIANGTASGDATAFGQIYCGFQAPVQVTTTTVFSTSSNTFQTTNLTASITPTSSAHRIKITVCGVLRSLGGGVQVFASIFNGASNLGGASGLAAQITSEAGTSGNVIYAPCSMVFIDSPASTSAQTYSVKIKNSDNSSGVGWGTNSNTQVMILEEIV